MNEITHQVQKEILKNLLFKPASKFSELNTLNLPNDHFTFHLKRLIELELVQKNDNHYSLTTKGLEHAARMDLYTMEFVKQPKIGVMICVMKEDKDHDYVLLGERLKNPGIGDVGFYTDKVRYGEMFYIAAKRCLKRETGLSADFKFCGVMHYITFDRDKRIIMDVVFQCFKAHNLHGDLEEVTMESRNSWMKYDDAYNIKNSFGQLDKELKLFRSDQLFYFEHVQYKDE